MGNCRLPFGYEMSDGRPVIKQAEAVVVRWIFQRYYDGESYNSLTSALQQQDVPYVSGKVPVDNSCVLTHDTSPSTKSWNILY